MIGDQAPSSRTLVPVYTDDSVIAVIPIDAEFAELLERDNLRLHLDMTPVTEASTA